MAAKKLKLFILISGQEVLAEVIHDVDPEYPNAFIVKQAMAIQLVPKGHDSYGIGLIPLSAINTEGEQRIFKNAVASEAITIPEDMVNAYIKRTSSIEIVSSPSLIQLQ
jgi:hypothetical protein